MEGGIRAEIRTFGLSPKLARGGILGRHRNVSRVEENGLASRPSLRALQGGGGEQAGALEKTATTAAIG